MVESYCLSNYFDTINRKTLKDIYDFMKNYPGTVLDEYIGKDFNFHNLIVESSKNDFIINFYHSLQEKIHFFMSIQEDLGTFRAQHLQIMNHIFSGDKNKATKILREHILYSTQVIKTKLFHLKSDRKKNEDYNGKK
ncbi:MAG TPA: hypothetical protein DCY12_02305 [Candidatus Atribacteria bacterium]|nr:hypothetical protein [Candidatus Atribacteria bacterium]